MCANSSEKSSSTLPITAAKKNTKNKLKHIAKWLALTLRSTIAGVLVSRTPDWTSLSQQLN